MLDLLLQLLGNPFNAGEKTWKGPGTVSYYNIPEEKRNEIINLLGVKVDIDTAPYIEIYQPESGRPTAQIYSDGDQTTYSISYSSPEVVLN